MPITDAVRPYQFKPGHVPQSRGMTRRMEIEKTCKKLGFDPIIEAITRYRDPKTTNASKDFCLGLVADRLYPKLKTMEIRAEPGSAAQQVLINIIAGNQPPTIESDSDALIKRDNDA